MQKKRMNKKVNLQKKRNHLKFHHLIITLVCILRTSFWNLVSLQPWRNSFLDKNLQ